MSSLQGGWVSPLQPSCSPSRVLSTQSDFEGGKSLQKCRCTGKEAEELPTEALCVTGSLLLKGAASEWRAWKKLKCLTWGHCDSRVLLIMSFVESWEPALTELGGHPHKCPLSVVSISLPLFPYYICPCWIPPFSCLNKGQPPDPFCTFSFDFCQKSLSVSSDFSSLVFKYVSWGGNLAAQGRSIRLGGSFSLRKGLFGKLGKKLNSCLWRCSSKTGKGEVELHRDFQGIKRTWSAWIHSPVPCNFVIHVSCVCYHLPVVRYSVRLRTPDVNGEAMAVMGQCILLCLLPAPDRQPDMREEQRISRKGVCVCVWCHLCEGILRLC